MDEGEKMSVTRLVSMAVLCLAATAARAEDCLPAGEIQAIAEHFTQFRDLANKGEYCFDDSPTSHLLKGISFMRRTRFANPMPNSADELFRGGFKNDWYSYFVERITDFRIQPSCERGVIAYVYFWGTSMYVCPLALTDAFTALDRASVFLHEARHIDGYPHYTCSRGARLGMSGACDNQISEQGSYAVTVETYAQISRYAVDLNPALRAYARSMAVVYADEAFNVPVKIDRTSRFLAVTNDGRFHALDLAAGTSVAMGRLPVAGRIAMRAQHMILMPDDKTLTSRYAFARDEGETTQSVGDPMADYDAGSPALRAEFKAAHFGGQWFAHAYRDHLRFNCGFGMTTPIDVRIDEVPESFVYPSGYTREATSAQMVTVSGRVYDVGCNGSREAFVRPASLHLDRPYKRLYRIGGDTLGLGADGRIYSVDENGTGRALTTDLAGEISELVPNQNVEFLDAVP